MDKLEEHIKKNRNDLDRYSPSSDNWRKIEKELSGKRLPLTRWLYIAAMFAVVIGSSVIFLSHESRNRESLRYGESNDINHPLNETEIYYNNLVNSLYNEVTPLLTGNPDIEEELTSDISQLDSICSDIKKDLRDNVANQEVVEALIQNYRIKIKILEEMITILRENEPKNEKSNSHEL